MLKTVLVTAVLACMCTVHNG